MSQRTEGRRRLKKERKKKEKKRLRSDLVPANSAMGLTRPERADTAHRPGQALPGGPGTEAEMDGKCCTMKVPSLLAYVLLCESRDS